MRVGVPRELKADEHRVALTPAGAAALRRRGHAVLVEPEAGTGSGYPDEAYAAAGARAVDAATLWREADLVVKVKEPAPEEWPRLREGQVLFTYLHLAAAPELTRALMASGATGIGYETVALEDGSLPLLAPMSEVAGRLAPQMGAFALERTRGGRGVLLAGLPGVPPGRVVVLGGGIVGENAARIAVGMGADVWLYERSVPRMRELESLLDRRVRLAMSEPEAVSEAAAAADLVIGAVLLPGARAPRLLGRADLARMRRGAALVDVSIDQGGCFETSRPTTHSAPTYVVDGVVHYCVANMPGAVPATATRGLTNVTLPYVELLADAGPDEAVRRAPELGRGVNVARGRVTSPPVAESLGLDYSPLARVLSAAA